MRVKPGREIRPGRSVRMDSRGFANDRIGPQVGPPGELGIALVHGVSIPTGYTLGVHSYHHLGLAIVCEVVATSCLNASKGFTRLSPALVAVAGYVVAFYFLALALRTIPTGVAYAIWSGIGIVLISTAGWVVFKQRLDGPALLGMGLIAAGVIVINVFSRTVPH